jgi:chromosome segregation ATPase
LVARHEAEKRNLTGRYERTLSEIRRQWNEHREDVHRLAAQVAQSERRNKEAKATIIDLKRETAKQGSQLKAQEEQMEREKKLSDAAAKSAVLTCQSECAAQLSQQRAQWDSERQTTRGSRKRRTEGPDRIYCGNLENHWGTGKSENR